MVQDAFNDVRPLLLIDCGCLSMHKVYLDTVEAIGIWEHETLIIPEDCLVPKSIRSRADICPEAFAKNRFAVSFSPYGIFGFIPALFTHLRGTAADLSFLLRAADSYA